MKTLKSIQKNQKQLNSLLMEKWGYKNALTEEKFDPGEQDEMAKKPSEKKKFEPGEQDEKAKKPSEKKKKESSKDIRAKYAGKHVDPGKQDEMAKKPSEREKFDPGKLDEDKPSPACKPPACKPAPGSDEQIAATRAHVAGKKGLAKGKAISHAEDKGLVYQTDLEKLKGDTASGTDRAMKEQDSPEEEKPVDPTEGWKETKPEKKPKPWEQPDPLGRKKEKPIDVYPTPGKKPKPEKKPWEQPDPLKEQDETLEEEHNCKSAHPGMNHEQWAGKHR